MAQRNYLISTTALSTTASGSTIGSGNTQAGSPVLARTLVRSGISAGEFDSGSQTWAVHYVVSAMSTPYSMALQLVRLNSGGTEQARSSFGTSRTATGTYDDNISWNAGTWAAGDQLVLEWWHFRPSGTGNKNGTIDANGASYIDAPQTSPDITLALTGVSATANVGTVGPTTSKALTGNEAIGAVGSLSPLIEDIKVRDTFTDTDATNANAHTAEVGGPWTAHPNSAANAFIASNRLTKDSGSGQALLMANATVTGDGYVQAMLRMLTSISVNAGLAISMNPGSDDYVYARHNRDSNEWSVRSTTTSGTSVLGTATETLSATDERFMRLERRTTGGNDQFRLLVDGVAIIDWVTSNGHTGTRVGWRFAGAASSTTGYALDNYEASEFVVPSPDITLALTGVSATGSVGSLTPNSPDITLALTGVSATALVGNLTPGGGLPAVRICTFNAQNGVGTDGSQDFARQVAVMTAGNDIVCMQERGTGVTGWNAGMSAAGFTEEIYRENGHGNDGPSIWLKSNVTLNATFDHALSTGAIGWDGSTNVDKAAVGVHVTVAGISFYVFNTHLAWSAGADSSGSTFSAIRVAQIAELMSWIDGIVGSNQNVIICGDMNFGPDYPVTGGGFQIDGILNEGYSDVWVQGITESKATADWNDRDGVGGADMPITSLTTRTHDTRRIDYYFLHHNAQMLLTAIDLPDLRANCSGALTGSPLFCPDVASNQRWGKEDDYGVRPSDHNLMNLTLALTPDVTVDITGVNATASAGTLGVARDKTLSGVSATGSLGTLGVSSSKALTGVTAASAIESLSPSFAVPLNGVAGTSALQSLTVSTTVPIGGVAGSGAVGSVTVEGSPDVEAALTGVQATGSPGTLAPSADLAISGVQAASESGTVGVSVTIALTGVQASGQAGTLAPATDAAISGSEAIGQAGQLAVALTVPLTGNQAIGAVGSVAVDSDTSITIQLSGVSATGQIGSVSPSREVQLSGVAGVSELGELGLSKGGSVALAGVQASAQAGSLTPEISPALSGNAAVTSIGNVSPSTSLTITSVSATGQPGSLSVSVDIGLTGVQGNSAVGSFGLGGEKIRTLNGRARVTIPNTKFGQSNVKVRNGR
jgi:endonuclease/exonuclease/phosphatase family metal-dependent hydrolase